MLSVLAALALVADTSGVRNIVVAPAETLRVTLSGSGRPVVLIPGLIGSAYNYRKILPGLTDLGLEAVIVEPLGVGNSSRPGDQTDYSYTAQANRVGAVLDSLGLRQVPVVAHAASASTALRLAVLHPELVDRVLLIQGGPDETAATSAVRKAVRFRFLIRLFGGRGRIKKEVRNGFVESSVDTSWITPEVVDSYTAGPAGDIGAVLRVLQGFTRAQEPDSIRDNLWRIQVPVRLLLGTTDVSGRPGERSVTIMEQRIPDFRIDSVPDVGLHIHEERPEAVVEEIGKWLGVGQRVGVGER
jgi:pimeloyl-ACP methyl ester carboxylesterase